MISLEFNIRRRTAQEIAERQAAIDQATPKFICCLCGKSEAIQERPRFRGDAATTNPVCLGCVLHWGNVTSGHVYQRQTTALLRQLSAAVNQLAWEVKNGKYKH